MYVSDLGKIQKKIASRDKKNYKTTKQFEYIIISCLLSKGESVKEAYSTLKILKIQDFISLQNALW